MRPGDTLWSIADAQSADGADWTALAALNLGREMGGGTRFVDPDHVRAGWSLVLPADARPPRERRDSGRTSAPPQALTSHLPELVALGMGSLACAGLARRARRRRQGHPFAGDLDIGRLSEGAVDAAVLLRRFEGVPALASFEAANCLLGRSLLDRQGRPALDPAVRAICVSPSGVTFWLAAPRADAPDGWVPVMGGNGWHVDHAALAGQEPFSPLYPVVVPCRRRRRGHLAGRRSDRATCCRSSVSRRRHSGERRGRRWVHGPGRTPSWSPTIRTIRIPVRGRGRSASSRDTWCSSGTRRHSPRRWRGAVPSSPPPRWPPATSPSSSTVTGPPSTRWAGWSAPISSRPKWPGTSKSCCRRPACRSPSRSTPGLGRRHAPRCSRGIEVLAPGPVDVRLLTMTPRLEGLREELPAEPGPPGRRAGRLSGPAPARRDHQRSAAHPRARVVGRRRRVEDAVQHGVRGPPCHGGRRAAANSCSRPARATGSTRSPSKVTVDVQPGGRAGRGGEDAGRRRSGHRLLPRRARPRRGRAAGERAVGLLVVGGRRPRRAHRGGARRRRLHHGCAGRRQPATSSSARWGLERARLVEPYSEALSRSAMQLAAAEGDADTAAPRMARVPAAGRRARSGKLAVAAHRVALRRAQPAGPRRCDRSPTRCRPRYAPATSD